MSPSVLWIIPSHTCTCKMQVRPYLSEQVEEVKRLETAKISVQTKAATSKTALQGRGYDAVTEYPMGVTWEESEHRQGWRKLLH